MGEAEGRPPRREAPRPLVVIGGVVTLFAVLAVLVALGAGGGLDSRIFDAVAARRVTTLDGFFTRFTRLGSWYILTPLVIAVSVALLIRGRRRAGLFLVLATGSALALNILLKLIVHRDPPGSEGALASAAHYSFPSGHTMTTTAFVTAVALMAWSTRWRWPVIAGAVAMAAAMGFSRVYVGVHWPSDVVAGWLMGFSTASLLWLALHPTPHRAAERTHDIRVVLFDWGNTLMVDDGQEGRMVDWPRVSAVPGAAGALTALHGRYRLCVATNADESGEAEVMAALGRVGLARFIDRVFSSRDLGARKPDPAFYAAVIDALREDAAARGWPSIAADQVVMVGDSYENDIVGAAAAGLRAVWFDPANDPTPCPHDELAPDGEIHVLGELPGIIDALGG